MHFSMFLFGFNLIPCNFLMRKKEPLRGQKAVSSSEFSSSQCLFTCWGGVSFLNHHSPPARAPLCYFPCASSSGRVPGANISPRRDALCFGGTSRSPSPGRPAGWHLPPQLLRCSALPLPLRQPETSSWGPRRL